MHDNLRLATEYLAPGDLKPPAREPRKHPPRQLKQIEASIHEHGLKNPILIDDHNRMVCGYGRLLAATAMNLALVPVIRLSHLSPEQLRLYAIADNKLAEQSEFDLAELRLELEELESLDLELNLELTGFSTSEIDDLLSSKIEVEEEDDEDEVPELEAVAVTRAGDLWQMGDHRLICGNALEAETYTTLLTVAPHLIGRDHLNRGVLCWCSHQPNNEASVPQPAPGTDLASAARRLRKARKAPGSGSKREP